MALSFSKSISCLDGLIRLNLSAKGIGISTGIKGARVSVGPTGTFISLAKYGLRYRKKLVVEKCSGPTLNEEYNKIYNTWKAIGYDALPACEKCFADLTNSLIYKSKDEEFICTECFEEE